jgi:hypothetical protein
MTPRLPYPVNIHLPPTAEEETRTQPRLTGKELDIVVPQDMARHETLGHFMNAWGALESTLAMCLIHLTELKLGDAHLLFPKLGMKNALDLLDGLGLRKLTPECAETFTKLIERVGKLITKRNILVHGQWVFEANVIVRRGEAILITQFLREVTPTDPEDAKNMANPRNQKARVRYTFTMKRIDATTRDTNELNVEILNFMHSALKYKVLPLSETLDLIAQSKPYRVTHS